METLTLLSSFLHLFIHSVLSVHIAKVDKSCTLQSVVTSKALFFVHRSLKVKSTLFTGCGHRRYLVSHCGRPELRLFPFFWEFPVGLLLETDVQPLSFLTPALAELHLTLHSSLLEYEFYVYLSFRRDSFPALCSSHLAFLMPGVISLHSTHSICPPAPHFAARLTFELCPLSPASTASTLWASQTSVLAECHLWPTQESTVSWITHFSILG